MRYSKPCQILVDEHDVIVSVIEAVEAMIDKSEHGDLNTDFFEKAFDFFAMFADKCHHGKEEVHLFPMLESRGIPHQGGPIGCMLHEHDEGRAHVGAVRDALLSLSQGDHSAGEVVRLEARAFCELLRQHIQKENQVLFVVGDQAMYEADKELLVKKFNCTQHDTLPAGTHEKYTSLAGELRKAAGLGPAAPGLSCNRGEDIHTCHHR
jgi:hemerythrin-like domain-containing protein